MVLELYIAGSSLIASFFQEEGVPFLREIWYGNFKIANITFDLFSFSRIFVSNTFGNL